MSDYEGKVLSRCDTVGHDTSDDVRNVLTLTYNTKGHSPENSLESESCFIKEIYKFHPGHIFPATIEAPQVNNGKRTLYITKSISFDPYTVDIIPEMDGWYTIFNPKAQIPGHEYSFSVHYTDEVLCSEYEDPNTNPGTPGEKCNLVYLINAYDYDHGSSDIPTRVQFSTDYELNSLTSGKIVGSVPYWDLLGKSIPKGYKANPCEIGVGGLTWNEDFRTGNTIMSMVVIPESDPDPVCNQPVYDVKPKPRFATAPEHTRVISYIDENGEQVGETVTEKTDDYSQWDGVDPEPVEPEGYVVLGTETKVTDGPKGAKHVTVVHRVQKKVTKFINTDDGSEAKPTVDGWVPEETLEGMEFVGTETNGGVRTHKYHAIDKVYFALTKTDVEGKIHLEGAEFVLMRVEGGKEVGDPIPLEQQGSGEKTKYVSGLIEPGTYNIIETKAPEGYELQAEKTTITVDKDGEVTLVSTHPFAKLINQMVKPLHNTVGNANTCVFDDPEMEAAAVEVDNEVKQKFGTDFTGGPFELGELESYTRFIEKYSPENAETNPGGYSIAYENGSRLCSGSDGLDQDIDGAGGTTIPKVQLMDAGSVVLPVTGDVPYWGVLSPIILLGVAVGAAYLGVSVWGRRRGGYLSR